MPLRPLFLIRCLALVIVFALVCVLATTRWGDAALFPPAPGSPAVEIIAADHGIHVALVLPRADVERVAEDRGLRNIAAVAEEFAGFDHLEFGWGDEDVYLRRLGLDLDSLGAGLRALSGANDAVVMFVGGIDGDPAKALARSHPIRLALSLDGFARLVEGMERGFAEDGKGGPRVVAVAGSGQGLFYRGAGHYNLANVCNHWTARLLASAGVPVSPIVDTLSPLLMLDLRLRAGATPAGVPPP